MRQGRKLVLKELLGAHGLEFKLAFRLSPILHVIYILKHKVQIIIIYKRKGYETAKFVAHSKCGNTMNQ